MATEPHPLRASLLGDLPAEAWPVGGDATGAPWDGFVRARDHLAAGDQDLAVRAWSAIAMTPGLEARHTLQAWHLLRSVGVQPDASISGEVLGVVAEVAVGDGHDVLAAYRDGSVRYLNHAGGATVVDPGGLDGLGPQVAAEVASAVERWLAIGQGVADATGPLAPGPWPDLPAGHTRVAMLTRAGPHLGQGPDEQLRAEPMAEAFLAAATAVLILIVDLPTPSSR